MPSRRPTSLAVAPSRPIACMANPCAGRTPGCPWAASSACRASMSVRNPANSSSGNSNPGGSCSAGAGGVANLDNLIYGIDNHVVYRSPADAGRSCVSGGFPMTSSPFPDHTLDSAPAGSRPVLAAMAKQGHVPVAVARLAASPQLLNGFLKASGLFESTGLDPVAREVVVLT